MTLIINQKVTLENREGQTLTENQIFNSHFPIYVDADQKVYQLIPSGKTMQRREVDPDSLNDIDGIQFLGAVEEMDEVINLIVSQRAFTKSIEPLSPGGTVSIIGLATKNASGFEADANVDGLTANRTVTYPDADAEILARVKVTLSSAQILDLSDTPVTLIPAPGAGKAIEVIGFMARMNFNSTAYDTNTTLHILADTAQEPQFQSDDFLVATATVIQHFQQVVTLGTSDSTIIENKAITAFVPGADPLNGDSTADIYLSYLIKTL